MEKNIFNTKRYFAAANGYDGFRSNFDSVFSPGKLKKLFVIKGGPGTGKSTLMRSIKEKMQNKGNIIEILCSSDTSSLDGLLIEQNGMTVGLADGTAPHVIEPMYPGAVEEIVNLGDGFDFKELMRRSNEIIKLANEKSAAYKKAYALLKAAGDMRKCIDRILFKNGVYKEAEDIADELLKNEHEQQKSDVEDRFLYSAFSRSGYTTLMLPATNKRIVGISSDGICEYCITAEIAKKLAKLGAMKAVYYSPFSKDMIDTVETDETVYTVINGNNTGVDNGILFVGHSDEYERMKVLYESVVAEAQSAFEEASKKHFMLEDIYSHNVSFDANDSKENMIIERINEVFNK